ncbi:MAG: SDR family NAD(P)-dependent oxidoreductase [Verrucomicrobia bacterium]|nr:SDR family NAD(P)-dependent oxidoreductase [Verrucomicrobiota bacterium]MBU4248585.1 SDR family NAD(P)-dependent oxidoreductase [Verrucomicrobiota bacterium]MBU4290525.1 SDR family NAD(P)-dependent oxidoreductase [Verrucomicrobiota bacterium]MBU4429138.1 SDR family NAD(P)-dependent oxidoreductase [Verrucomicrobiota bacterium]MCG2680704.1 SDR family NAD(P)-dependent oxidoreductase [Kiritimatiellia bacterium]
MNLENKTVLVTGGAIRVGRAICEALAREGCRVVIHCNRSVREARSLAARLRRGGTPAWVVTGDFRTAEACERVMARAFQAAGTMDILINNAAVFHKQTLMTASDADLCAEWEVNLAAPLRLIRAFARRVRRGKIINILDRRIASCRPDAVPYTLSKRMLAELTLLAALELAPAITVNGVAPGAVLAADRKGSVREKAGRFLLQQRPAVADVAHAIVFLLQCDSITGQIVYVDSGQHLLGSDG